MKYIIIFIALFLFFFLMPRIVIKCYEKSRYGLSFPMHSTADDIWTAALEAGIVTYMVVKVMLEINA